MLCEGGWLSESLTCGEALEKPLEHLNVARYLLPGPEHLVRLAVVALVPLLPIRDALAGQSRVQQPMIDPEVLRDEHVPAIQDSLGAKFLAGHLRDQEQRYFVFPSHVSGFLVKHVTRALKEG